MYILYWKNSLTGVVGHGEAILCEYAYWAANNTFIENSIYWVEKI